MTGMRIGCGILVLAMLLVAAPLPAQAAEWPLEITVQQIFTATSASVEDGFTYKLKPLRQGAPMPEENTAEGYTFTISGSENTEIGPLRYSEPGLYQYELFQVVEQEKPGYQYDRCIYTIDVYVGAGGAVLTARNQCGIKVDNIRFQNTFHLPPVSSTSSSSTPDSSTTRSSTTGSSSSGSTDKPSSVVKDPDDMKNSMATPGGGHNGRPQTGDSANLFFYAVLLVLALLSVVGATAYLILSGKAKKDDEK